MPLRRGDPPPPTTGPAPPSRAGIVRPLGRGLREPAGTPEVSRAPLAPRGFGRAHSPVAPSNTLLRPNDQFGRRLTAARRRPLQPWICAKHHIPAPEFRRLPVTVENAKPMLRVPLAVERQLELDGRLRAKNPRNAD